MWKHPVTCGRRQFLAAATGALALPLLGRDNLWLKRSQP